MIKGCGIDIQQMSSLSVFDVITSSYTVTSQFNLHERHMNYSTTYTVYMQTDYREPKLILRKGSYNCSPFSCVV